MARCVVDGWLPDAYAAAAPGTLAVTTPCRVVTQNRATLITWIRNDWFCL